MRRFLFFLLCAGLAALAMPVRAQEPVQADPIPYPFLVANEAVMPAAPVDPPDPPPLPAAEPILPAQPLTNTAAPNVKVLKAKPVPAPIVAVKKATPVPPVSTPPPPESPEEDEMILYATKVEAPEPPPEIILQATKPPPPEIILHSEPPPRAAEITLPALPVEPPAVPEIPLPTSRVEITIPPKPPSQLAGLLEKNYADPTRLEDLNLDHLTESSLPFADLPGVEIVPKHQEEGHGPLRPELLPDHIGYCRAAGFSPTGGWEELRHQIKDWSNDPELAGVILDLRGTATPNDFAGAAQVASLFLFLTDPLFIIQGPQTMQKGFYTGEPEHLYSGSLIVLIDDRTRGAAEALADVLRRERNAILVGQPTAGQAALYSQFPLASGSFLRMPIALVHRPDDVAFFGQPIHPDIAIEVDPATEAEVVTEIDKGSAAKLMAEAPVRAPVNETTLARDLHPEVEAIRRQEKQLGHGEEKKGPIPDLILLGGIDAVKAIHLFPTPPPPRIEVGLPVSD